MADMYWVGGLGAWDASSTTNWSATSGGAGGASSGLSRGVGLYAGAQGLWGGNSGLWDGFPGLQN